MKELKKLLSTKVTTKPEAVIYIGKIHQMGFGYHFDDDATLIEFFGEKLGKLANKRADECFDLLSNTDYCPHSVGLACFID